MILSIVDIIIGLMIAYPTFILFTSIVIFYTSLIYVGKGLWSIFSSLAGGYYYDWMGVLDVVYGAALFAIYSGISNGIFYWIGIIAIVEGIYSFFRSL